MSKAQGAGSPDITSLCFNQDQTCLAVGTGVGFIIFNTDTCALLHHEECGGVSIVEMLFRTSLLALVGHSASRRSLSSEQQLTMWNTKERCKLCHVCFEDVICSVRMSHRRIVVLLRDEVHILDLKSMKRLHVISRTPSPLIDPTLASLCSDSDCGYLALPMVQPSSGCAQADEKIGLVSLVDSHTLQPVGVLLAHRSPVQALALNLTGDMLATASSTASVIRVFTVPSLQLHCVFRRGTGTGTNPCHIFGLHFSRDSQFLCAAASSGTVHIFKHSDRVLTDTPSPKGASAPPSLRPVVRLGPENSADHFATDIDDGEDDMDEWNVVQERPERALEQLQKRDALQTLSEASENAVGNVAKHARSLFQLLPQSCRELVDAERAFATIHLQEDEAPSIAEGLPAVSLSTVLGVMHGSGLGSTSSSYIACANMKTSGSGTDHLEALVATRRRGCACVYGWGANSGGEGRLRDEHSLEPVIFDASQPRPTGVTAQAQCAEKDAGYKRNVSDAQLGA